MKKITAISLLFLSALQASAEKKLSKQPAFIDFSDKPALHNVPPEYANEHALIVSRDETIDYVYEGRTVNGYKTVRTIWKILDSRGIDFLHSLGITADGKTRFINIKARTIHANGKVQEVPQDMIKVTVDANGRYKIVIAPEGLEKYAEVELMLKEIVPGYHSIYDYFQFGIPMLSSRLDISYPKDYAYESRSYNGMPKMTETTIGTRKHLRVAVSNVPAFKAEPYSFADLHRMKVDIRRHHYAFANYNDPSEIDTWDDFGRDLFDDYYKITDKERGAVNRYLSELGVQAGGDELENIKKIENGIKHDIVQYGYVQGAKTDVLDSIIAKKQATPYGYIKLFAACFTQAEVNHELGKAGDKSENRTDDNFEIWGYLDNPLFYFPGQKKFMDPLSMHYRYPLVPDEIAGGKGVFCNIPPKGVVTGRLYKMRTITPLSAKQTHRNVAAGVTFNDNMDATVDVSYSFTGYASADIRTALNVLTKEKEKDIIKEVVDFTEKREDITKYFISNDAPESYNGNKPLVITATVDASHMTEKAGEKYIFNVGELIGLRAGLYDKKERHYAVDLDYPHSNYDTITINIPKGYKVVNADGLRMQSEFLNRDLKKQISFSSDYNLITDKKNGDKLVVMVSEYFPVTHFPVADYDRFRDVINTASDFSKSSIILERVKGSGGKAKPKTKALAKK